VKNGTLRFLAFVSSLPAGKELVRQISLSYRLRQETVLPLPPARNLILRQPFSPQYGQVGLSDLLHQY